MLRKKGRHDVPLLYFWKIPATIRFNSKSCAAKEFALQIIRLFSELPKTTEAQVLGKQVLRSGTSVGANYRGSVSCPAGL